MANREKPIHIRADWSGKILLYLYQNIDSGLVSLNEFAIEVLKINPDNIKEGQELNLLLQGMENSNLIFYEPFEKIPEGKKLNSLNNVDYRALLQSHGHDIIISRINIRQTRNLSIISMFIAAFAVTASLVSVIFQANGNTDKQLLQLNQQLQKPLQTLESMQQSQKGIDASLRQIKDSLKTHP